MDINEIKGQLKLWPQYQADVIKEDDFERFSAFIHSLPEKDHRFHCIRSGIGGSEIIEAIRHYVELHPDRIDWSHFGDDYFSGFSFSTPRLMAGIKLMINLPSEASDRMNIGTRFESTVIQMYLEDNNLKRRIDIESAIKSFKSETFPWLRGTPDLVVEYPDGRIKLVDVKVPAEASSSIMPGYAAQLSYYRLIAEVLTEFDVIPPMEWDCDLVQLDFSNAGVRVLKLDGNDVKSLIPLIIEAGDFFWNERIMRGELPAKKVFKKPSLLDNQDKVGNEESRDFYAGASRIRILSMMIDLLKNELEQQKDEAKQVITEHPSLASKAIKLSTRNTLNKLAIQDMIDHGSSDILDEISIKEIKDVDVFIEQVRSGLKGDQLEWFKVIIEENSRRVPLSSTEIKNGLKNNGFDPSSVFKTSTTLSVDDDPDEVSHAALRSLATEATTALTSKLDKSFIDAFLSSSEDENVNESPDNA